MIISRNKTRPTISSINATISGCRQMDFFTKNRLTSQKLTTANDDELSLLNWTMYPCEPKPFPAGIPPPNHATPPHQTLLTALERNQESNLHQSSTDPTPQ